MLWSPVVLLGCPEGDVFSPYIQSELLFNLCPLPLVLLECVTVKDWSLSSQFGYSGAAVNPPVLFLLSDEQFYSIASSYRSSTPISSPLEGPLVNTDDHRFLSYTEGPELDTS